MKLKYVIVYYGVDTNNKESGKKYKIVHESQPLDRVPTPMDIKTKKNRIY